MKKILSIFLTLCIIVNMLAVTTMAEEMHTNVDASREIISFAPITESEKSVAPATFIEDLELPETLDATVPTAFDFDMQADIMPLKIMAQAVGNLFLAPITIGEKNDVMWKFIILTEADDDTNGTVTISGPNTGNEQKHTGDLIIPERVTNGGKTYDVTEIGDNAFNSCKMSSVFIPKAIGGNIGVSVFSAASNLVAINVDPDNKSFTSDDGVLYNKDKTTLIRYPQGKIGETFTIPVSVNTLSSYAFSGCNNIKSINIPENITNIGERRLFFGCSALEEVTIPSKVSDIPKDTFYNCTALKLITFNRMTAPTLSGSAFGSYPNQGYFPKDLRVKIPAGSSGYIGDEASDEWKALADKIEVPSPVQVTSYNIWVGGVQVTSENASNVLGDKEATVTYTPATGDTAQTLTLNGANITYNGGNSIYTKMQDIIVVLNGTNSVKSTSINDDTAFNTISGGSITFRGNGSLTASGKYGGIYAYDNLTIESGTIFATGQKAGISCNWGSITISGGNVTGQATTSSGYGIGRDHSRTLKLTVSGDAIVTAVGTNGATASKSITITNTTHNVIAGDNESSAKVVVSLEESTWANSYVKLNPGNTISGIITSGEKTISGANVQIQKNGVDFGVPAITAGDGTYTTQYVPDGDYTIKVSRNGYNHAEIEEFTVSGSPVSGKNQNLTVTSLTGTATISNPSPRIGDVLNGSLDSGNNTGTLTYIWKADETQVGTGENYTVAETDLGKTITLEISSDAQTGTVKSMPTMAVLKKVDPSSPDAPTLFSKTHNTVTLTANGTYEFSKDGTTWQTSNVFSGLTESTTYLFYQRIAETNDTEASAASTGLSVTTNSNSGGGGSGSSSESSGDGGGSGNSGGSSSGSDSSDTSSNSSHVIVTPPAPDKPNDPTQGEIKVPGTADGKGNITVNITNKTVTDAFDKALADAKKNGNDQNGITVVLRVDTGSKTGSNVTVNLPKIVQDTIIAKKIVNTIVVVDNPDIRIGMDLETVQEINKQAKSDVNITTNRRDSYKLTGDAKKAIGSRPVFEFKVNYGGGKQVQSFGTGNVSVTIPYTLGTNEKAENVQAVYVDGNGKVHWLVNSVYDSVEKVLRFSTNHFSTYGVGYKEDAPSFTDIASHWAKEDIEFVVSSGLFSGTSATTFSPNTAMTRGMFVTALGRLANADVSSYNKSNFTDVKSDAYYMSYVEWASKNSIVNGTGNGKFAPDQSITREQMAVIMENYAKVISFTMPKAHGENTFADSSKISTYAKDAVKAMQMAGVINGKNGNLFDPQGTATRAEVAAVLRRFVELEI